MPRLVFLRAGVVPLVHVMGIYCVDIRRMTGHNHSSIVSTCPNRHLW